MESSFNRVAGLHLYGPVRCSGLANGSHHPARASKATMSKTPDRVLGVHGFVIRTCYPY